MVYYNETAIFRIVVNNTGETLLSDIVLSHLPSEANISISPPNYTIMRVGESRPFLVLLNTMSNETLTFLVTSNATAPVYLDVNVTYSPYPPVYNTTFMLEKFDTVSALVNDTFDVLSFLSGYGYFTDVLELELGLIVPNLTRAREEIERGSYAAANELLNALVFDIEEIYLDMQFITYTPEEISVFLPMTLSIIIGACLAFLGLLVPSQKTKLLRLIICLSIVNIAVVAYFFSLVGQLNLFYAVVGAILGVVAYTQTRAVLGIKRRFFKDTENYKLFLFTVFYFVGLAFTLLLIIHASNTLNQFFVQPMAMGGSGILGPGYTIVVVDISRQVSGSSGVNNRKLPPDTDFSMTLVLDTEDPRNDTLYDYFPNAFEMVSSGGGTVSPYNAVYNVITFNATAPGNYTYTLRSPGEGVYHFGKARFNRFVERQAFKLDVVETSDALSPDTVLPQAGSRVGEFDGVSYTMSRLGYVEITGWDTRFPLGADLAEATLFVELPFASPDASIHVSITRPFLEDVCDITPSGVGTFSCVLPLNRTDQINDLSVKIEVMSGTVSVDYVYIKARYLQPPGFAVEVMSEINEVETGDNMDYIRLRAENMGGSLAEGVSIATVLQHTGGDSRASHACGHILPGGACDFVLGGFAISPGEYHLFTNVSWHGGSNATIVEPFETATQPASLWSWRTCGAGRSATSTSRFPVDSSTATAQSRCSSAHRTAQQTQLTTGGR
jgi:hypothetical protein